MGAIVGILAKLFNAIGINTATAATSAIVQKALMLTCFVVILPIVLKNTILWVMDKSFELATSGLNPVTQQDAMTLQLTSLGGWLAHQLNFAGCLSVILTACAVRLTLRTMRLL